ncbi:hypothetical protein HYW75_01150 [Candidatus Pacearchaeota archaeon]|nr:hypothetical protein [Candidatus Pacearchaeota archaeon]
MTLFPSILSEEELKREFEKYRLPFDFKNRVDNYGNKQTLTSQKLALFSALRIYTEWYMDDINGAGKNLNAHGNYQGEAFEKFLNDEKLFAAQRSGYIEMPLVVDAFVRSALDFFIYQCEWKTFNPIKTGVNIRRSLEPWINNPSLLDIVDYDLSLKK